MSEAVTYRANFVRFGVEYQSRDFKTGRGCINFIRREWENLGSTRIRGDGWYMVRRTGYFGEQGYRVKGVILAQSKDCKTDASTRKFREVG